jgi:hypothetical protein
MSLRLHPIYSDLPPLRSARPRPPAEAPLSAELLPLSELAACGRAIDIFGLTERLNARKAASPQTPYECSGLLSELERQQLVAVRRRPNQLTLYTLSRRGRQRLRQHSGES